MINFKNKNVLITGATGGIGNDLVKKFVSLEANVLGSGTKTEKLDEIKKKYPNIKVKKFDMSDHSRIEEIIDDAYIFHAGTKKHEEKILTNGGRVLGVTALGDTLESAVNTAYQIVEKVTWANKYCRTDIGKKGLNFT